MNILVSCLGNSDPIRGCYDGPFLHIIRYEKEILKKNSSDQFDKAIVFVSNEVKEKLEDYNWVFEEYKKKFCRENLYIEYKYFSHDVFDFNTNMCYFNEQLKNIYNDYGLDEIYFNISSGTPQMQSSLVFIISQLNSIHFHPLQVYNPTPNDSKTDKGSLNKDQNIRERIFANIDDEIIDSRVNNINLITYIKSNDSLKIDQLLKTYNYGIVNELFQFEMQENKTLQNLVLFGFYRKRLLFEKALNCLDNSNIDKKLFIPYFNNTLYIKNKEGFILLEYYYALKLSKDLNYNDFIIRFEPFSITFLIEVLKRYFQLNKYLKCTKINAFGKVNYVNTISLAKLEQDYPDLAFCIRNDCKVINDEEIEISIKHLKYFIEFLNLEKFKDFADTSYLLHKCLRNDLAHKLIVAKKQDVEDIIPINKLIDIVEDGLIYLYGELYLKKSYFNPYDVLNNEIKKIL